MCCQGGLLLKASNILPHGKGALFILFLQPIPLKRFAVTSKSKWDTQLLLSNSSGLLRFFNHMIKLHYSPSNTCSNVSSS